MTTGEITSKDVAAEWAMPLLPKEHVTLLDIARKGYQGSVMISGKDYIQGESTR